MEYVLELAERAKAGDEEAIDNLVELLRGYIFTTSLTEHGRLR